MQNSNKTFENHDQAIDERSAGLQANEQVTNYPKKTNSKTIQMKRIFPTPILRQANRPSFLSQYSIFAKRENTGKETEYFIVNEGSKAFNGLWTKASLLDEQKIRQFESKNNIFNRKIFKKIDIPTLNAITSHYTESINSVLLTTNDILYIAAFFTFLNQKFNFNYFLLTTKDLKETVNLISNNTDANVIILDGTHLENLRLMNNCAGLTSFTIFIIHHHFILNAQTEFSTTQFDASFFYLQPNTPSNIFNDVVGKINSRYKKMYFDDIRINNSIENIFSFYECDCIQLITLEHMNEGFSTATEKFVVKDSLHFNNEIIVKCPINEIQKELITDVIYQKQTPAKEYDDLSKISIHPSYFLGNKGHTLDINDSSKLIILRNMIKIFKRMKKSVVVYFVKQDANTFVNTNFFTNEDRVMIMYDRSQINIIQNALNEKWVVFISKETLASCQPITPDVTIFVQTAIDGKMDKFFLMQHIVRCSECYRLCYQEAREMEQIFPSEANGIVDELNKNKPTQEASGAGLTEEILRIIGDQETEETEETLDEEENSIFQGRKEELNEEQEKEENILKEGRANIEEQVDASSETKPVLTDESKEEPLQANEEKEQMKNTEEKPNIEENVETSSETYSMLTNESKEDHSIVNEQIENSEENKEEKINNEEQVDTLSETNAVLINENKEEHLTANEETEEIKNPEENKEEKQIIEEHVEISNETNPMLTNKSKEEHLAVNEEKEQTKNIEENKEENVEQIQQTVTTNEIKNEEEVNKDEEEQNQNEQETNKEEGEEISKSEEVEQIKDEAPEKEEKKENEEEENKDAPKKKSSKKHSKSKKKEKIRVLDDKELFKVVMKFILTFSIEEEDKIKDVQNGYITAVLFVQWTMEYADIYTPILSTTMDKIREQKKTELEEAEPVLFQKFYLDVIRFARFNIMRINELAIISYAIHNNIEIPQIPFLTKHKKVTVFNKTLITDVWRAGFLNVIARKGYDYYRLAQRFSQIANAIQHSLDEKCPDSISYKLMKTYGDFMIEVQSTGVFTMKDTYEHTSSKIYKSIDFQTFEHLMSTIIIGFEINCEDFIFLAPKEAMYNTLYIVGMKQQIADLISLGCDDERMLLLKRFLMNSKPKMPQEISRCFKTKTFVTALHKLKEIVDELYAKVKPQKIKILKDVSDEEIMEIKRQLKEAYPPKTEKKPEPMKRRTRSSEKMKETQETQEKTTRRRTTTRVKQPEKKEKTPKEDEKMSDYYSYSSSSESEDQEPDKSESTSRKHITKKKLEVPKTFPWVVTSEVTIINLGSVCNEEKYSSSKYVFNPGYTALTLFYYYGDTSEDEVNYKCEIIKGDGRPIFRVTCEKDEQVSEGTTPSNAWRPFLKNQSVAHSGAALFGLSIPSVHAVLMAEKRRVEAEINEQSEIKKEKKKAPTVKPSSSQPVQREYNVESSKEPKLSFSFLPEAFEVGPVLGFDFHGITEEEFKAKLFDEDLE